MTWKHHATISLLCAAFGFLAACGNEHEAPDSIQVTPATLRLAVGATSQLTATAFYHGGRRVEDITQAATWMSTDESVMTVDDTGLVTAIAPGTAVIHASLDEVTSNDVDGTVIAAQLLAINLDPPLIELHAGSPVTAQLTATGIFDDGTHLDVTNQSTWTSSATEIAMVDASGTVSAGAEAGTAQITASIGEITSSPSIIEVLPSSEVTDLTVEPQVTSIPAGFREEFTAVATYADGRTENVTDFALWTTSNPAVATVDDRGIATGVSVGNATITATFVGESDQASLTVTSATLERIELEPEEAFLALGASETFTAIGVYSDGSARNVSLEASWSSSDPTIATVEQDGTATAIEEGSVVIRAAIGDTVGTADLMVTAAVLERLEVEPALPGPLAVGRTLSMTATGVYTDGTTANLTAHVNLTWSSSAPTIASVSNAPSTAGVVTGLTPGATSIGAMFDDGNVQVTAPPVALSIVDATLVSISITPANPTLPAGFDMAFRATGLFSNDTTGDVTDMVTWSSSNDMVATLSNAPGSRGQAVALAAGTVTIRATSGSLSASTRLTVTDATLVSVSVTPPSADVPIGSTRQFTATGNFDDGSTLDLTKRVTWSIDPIDVGRGVSVSNVSGREGLASVSSIAVPSLDPVTIHATRDGVVGVAELVVVASRTLTGILVELEPELIPVGRNAQATALGVYSDGVHSPELEDITQLVTWSPVVGGIATVSNAAGSKGRVTGLAAGTTEINACLGAICANDPGGSGATAIITVTNCPFQSVQIRPDTGSDLELPRGTSRAYRAYAIFDADVAGCAALEGEEFEVTKVGSWSTSNTAVATVSNATDTAGLVTAADSPPSPTVDLRFAMGALTDSLTLSIIDACVDSIVITPTPVNVPAGIRLQLQASAALTDGTQIDDYTMQLTWSDEPTGFVSLAGPGLLESFAPGMEIITATQVATSSCPRVAETVTVTVNDSELTSIMVRPQSLSLAVGATEQLEALGQYDDGRTFDLTDQASWTSANNSVATVSSGLVRGMSPGNVVILATFHTVTGVANINVGGRDVESISIEPDDAFECGTLGGAYPRGVDVPFRAFATYSDGSGPEDVTSLVSWTSSSSAVVIDSAGRAQMSTTGTSTLRAALEGVMGELDVSVFASTLTSIEVRPDDFVIPLEATRQFGAFGFYRGPDSLGSARCDITALSTWGAVPSASLTVGPTGFVVTSDVPTVTATVTATRGTVSGAAHGEVRGECVDSLRVRPQTAFLPVGLTQQFFVDAILSDGSASDVTDDATWASSNTGVATITGTGFATTVASGTATISATLDAGPSACSGTEPVLSTTAIFSVSPASLVDLVAVCSEGLKFWGSDVGIPAGVQMQCTAFGEFSDGSVRDVTEEASWSTGDTNVATVSNVRGQRGLVSALSVGTTSLQARLSGITSTLEPGGGSLRVVAATLESIVLSPSADSLPVGFKRQFEANGRFTLGDVTHSYTLTRLATWSSSDTTRAIVSDLPPTRGLAETLAVSATPVVISAAYLGVTGTANLDVNDAELERLEITPSEGTLAQGQTRSFEATGIYTNTVGTFTQDISEIVTWSTTNPTVASIDSGGVVRTFETGTVVVTAELGSASGAAFLSIGPACIESIQLTPASSAIPAGVPIRYAVSATFSDNSRQDVTESVIFLSSDPTRVAAPGPDGWTESTRSASFGTAEIRAILEEGTCGEAVDTASLILVNSAVLQQIQVTDGSANLPVGLSSPFGAVGFYSDGSSHIITRTIDNWATGSTSVAVVDTSGLVTGRGEGTTPVVATQGSVSGSGDLMVTTAVLTEIQVEGLRTREACLLRSDPSSWVTTGFEHPGGNLTTWVRAIGTFSDGSERNVTDLVVWNTGNQARAVVSNSTEFKGRVTTLASGEVLLTATSLGGVQGSRSLNVVDSTFDRLQINRDGVDPVVLALGNEIQLTVQGRVGTTYYCVTPDALYESSDEAVAVVSNGASDAGFLESLNTGLTTITASIGTVNDTILATVEAKTLDTVEIVPASLELLVGETAQLHAIGHYSDGTSNDITFDDMTSWSSSNTDTMIMTLTKGLVRAVNTGVASIDACALAVCASGDAHQAEITVTSP